MSELIKTKNGLSSSRLGLLASTSALALAACVTTLQQVQAADRPAVWIEGGWQFESVTGSNDVVTPPLNDLTTKGYPTVPTVSNFFGQGSGGFPSFVDLQKELGQSGGAEGSISFQPKGSDWIFSISGRYGRMHPVRSINERKYIYGRQGRKVSTVNGGYLFTPHYTNYASQTNDSKESHAILDFKVGRDVGVGLFGNKTESTFYLGARYAQMSMSSKGHAYAAPAVKFYGHGGTNVLGKYYYTILPYHHASATIVQRYSNFHGIGPSLTWSNMTRLLGDSTDGEIALDWGANAAVLFGRQRTKLNYSTIVRSYYYAPINIRESSIVQHKTVHRTQSHRVTVPNLGGFAALSYRFTNAKLSMGYRADFFFGALDRGLDTRHSVTTGFNGPFATISVGLGG